MFGEFILFDLKVLFVFFYRNAFMNRLKYKIVGCDCLPPRDYLVILQKMKKEEDIITFTLHIEKKKNELA